MFVCVSTCCLSSGEDSMFLCLYVVCLLARIACVSCLICVVSSGEDGMC